MQIKYRMQKYYFQFCGFGKRAKVFAGTQFAVANGVYAKTTE